jgi:hypothetical protein
VGTGSGVALASSHGVAVGAGSAGATRSSTGVGVGVPAGRPAGAEMEGRASCSSTDQAAPYPNTKARIITKASVTSSAASQRAVSSIT